MSRKLKQIVVTAKVPATTIKAAGRLKKKSAAPPITTAAEMSAKAQPRPSRVALSTTVRLGAAVMSAVSDMYQLVPLCLNNFCHGDTEPFIDDNHFTAGDQAIIHVDVDRFPDFAVQFDDCAAAEFEELIDLH